jgi:carbonic anhydrase/acetyltransferase-like protein (isoleucine patch superfamily)
MGSILLDGAVIPDDSMIGAGSVVTPGKTFPQRYLILGSPAKAVRPLSEQEIEFLKISAKQYVLTAQNYFPLATTP